MEYLKSTITTQCIILIAQTINILTTLTVTARGDNCPNPVAIQNDVFIKHFTFRHIQASSVYDCAAECMTSSICRSFHIDTRSRTCHLNSKSSDIVDTDPKPNFVFSDIKYWNKSLTGPCASVTCNASSRCRSLRANQAFCVFEIGVPEKVSDSTVSYSRHFVHDVAKIACKSDFRSCCSQNKSVCQANGEWTENKPRCERFKWHHPMVPFLGAIPCQDRSFQLIRIKATPTKKTKMVFNLNQGADILFHVSCRFKFLMNQLVLNSKLGGHYGPERITLNFPFIVNTSFLLDMTLKNGTYQIQVDGIKCCIFKERRPAARPGALQIQGDLKVESVEIFN